MHVSKTYTEVFSHIYTRRFTSTRWLSKLILKLQEKVRPQQQERGRGRGVLEMKAEEWRLRCVYAGKRI